MIGVDELQVADQSFPNTGPAVDPRGWFPGENFRLSHSTASAVPCRLLPWDPRGPRVWEA